MASDGLPNEELKKRAADVEDPPEAMKKQRVDASEQEVLVQSSTDADGCVTAEPFDTPMVSSPVSAEGLASPQSSPPPQEDDDQGSSAAVPATSAVEKAQVLEELPISRLKSIAKFHSISLQGCLEKQDIVNALRRRGINDSEVSKEKRAELEKQERARIAAEEKEKAKAKAEPTLASKIPVSACLERTLKTNVAKAWGYVIAANTKENLLNWRPGRRPAKADTSESEKPSDVEVQEPAQLDITPKPSVPGVPHVVAPPPLRPPPVAAPKSKPSASDPWSTLNLGNEQEILNTHPNVHADLCWNFMKGGCQKGVRCQWRHPAY